MYAPHLLPFSHYATAFFASLAVMVFVDILLGPRAEYLNAYTGKYYCPELETVYEIRMENGGLVGGNWRHRNLPLKFLGEDYWEDTEGPLGEIRFERDEKGRVTGMRVTGGGVVNLWMERVRG